MCRSYSIVFYEDPVSIFPTDLICSVTEQFSKWKDASKFRADEVPCYQKMNYVLDSEIIQKEFFRRFIGVDQKSG